MPVGLYGKYPEKRDFIALNMPRPVLQPLEKWIQSGLAASKEKLGRAWGDHYMIQPIWSFRLGASITGVDCLGAMAPSVDGVGRTFPLVILAHAPEESGGYPSIGVLDPDHWFPDVHDRLLHALDEEAPGEPRELLDGVAEPGCLAADQSAGVSTIANGQRTLFAEGELKAAFGHISEIGSRQTDRMTSVWWTSGSETVPAQVAVFTGMPDVWFMADMMSGSSAEAQAGWPDKT
ncbi:type VI secretion system-associated protein TagF [Hoeflea ulvae]|uniref:Type VI secretion system-associated protein TagF n=1 Tax=Hoeflea ulvae TaxID=2983764 RepID=A0ABT3YHS3_9HYPH|nr:type VI secretion system-associated protein TagF [Hoeflea ulvae]MCY0095177.1 type VI secretion system-associated protein TagF [Hoeflea ulvae]